MTELECETKSRMIGDMTAAAVAQVFGPQCVPVVVIVEPDAETRQTRLHVATPLPPELAMEVLSALRGPKEAPEATAPGEATASDIEAWDGDLSGVSPGQDLKS